MSKHNDSKRFTPSRATTPAVHGTAMHPAAHVPLGGRIKAAVAAFVAILLVTSITQQFQSGLPAAALMASMGASAVLLFVLPNSPLAQPWSFVMGHLVPTVIGLCVASYVHNFMLAAALAVGLSLIAMYVLECVHPPGGAATLTPVIAAQTQPLGLDFLLLPVALNVAIMLVLAYLLNRYWLKKRYPAPQLRAHDPVHRHDDPAPLQRGGVEVGDFRRALQHLDVVIDVTEHDLVQLYQAAKRLSFERQVGAVLCRDIMSHDVISVRSETSLEHAWALLRWHKVKVLPVVDAQQRVIGVVSLVDFLKRLDMDSYRSYADSLLALVRKRLPGRREKTRVEEIMVRTPATAQDTEHIAAVVEMLSDRGLHQIPIVDADRRLVGIVTQSDLIAALYAQAGTAVPAAATAAAAA